MATVVYAGPMRLITSLRPSLDGRGGHVAGPRHSRKCTLLSRFRRAPRCCVENFAAIGRVRQRRRDPRGRRAWHSIGGSLMLDRPQEGQLLVSCPAPRRSGAWAGAQAHHPGGLALIADFLA